MILLVKTAILLLKTSDDTDSSSLQNSVVDDEFIVDTVVSSDGTWQKRGYDSLNGIVTVIQNDVGKCVDFRCPWYSPKSVLLVQVGRNDKGQ